MNVINDNDYCTQVIDEAVKSFTNEIDAEILRDIEQMVNDAKNDVDHTVDELKKL